MGAQLALHPAPLDELLEPPLSAGRFYLRVAMAAAGITGGMVLLVWYTNR